jgi:Pyruvate/2-oxoacid:ferredoxin oxidoreductase gamma subunit
MALRTRFSENTINVKFLGMGGQGVVMASQMLGLAFFRAGMCNRYAGQSFTTTMMYSDK